MHPTINTRNKSTFSSTLDRKSTHITTVMSDEDAAYLAVSVLKKRGGEKKIRLLWHSMQGHAVRVIPALGRAWCPRESKRFVPNPAETDGDSFTGMDQSVDGAPHQPPPHVCLTENLWTTPPPTASSSSSSSAAAAMQGKRRARFRSRLQIKVAINFIQGYKKPHKRWY